LLIRDDQRDRVAGERQCFEGVERRCAVRGAHHAEP
jgi:hypothetical protein